MAAAMAAGVPGQGDRTVHQNGVGTHLQGLGRFAGDTDAGVHHHRHASVFDDQPMLAALFRP